MCSWRGIFQLALSQAESEIISLISERYRIQSLTFVPADNNSVHHSKSEEETLVPAAEDNFEQSEGLKMKTNEYDINCDMAQPPTVGLLKRKILKWRSYYILLLTPLLLLPLPLAVPSSVS